MVAVRQLAQTVGFNAALLALSRVVNAALSIVIIGVLTRVLGTNTFGEWSLVIAYGTILYACADWGLYSLLARDIARPGADEAALVRVYFWLRAAALGGVFALGVAASFALPLSSAVRSGLVIASFFFAFNSLSQILSAVFQKHLAMFWVGAAELAGKLCLLVVVLLGARRFGLAGVLAGLAFSGLVQFFILRFAVRLFVVPAGRTPAGWLKRSLVESWPMAVSIGLTLVYFKGDALLLGFLKPSSDVAIYGLAYSVLEHLIFFPAMFMGLMLPRLAARLSESRGAFRILLQQIFDLFFVAGLPIVVGLVFVADKIALLLGGPNFRASGGVMTVLGVATALIFFGNLFGSAVVVLGRQKSALRAYLAGFVTMLAVDLALIPRYSYFGTAWGTVATEIVVTVLLVRIVCKGAGVRLSLKRCIRILPAVAVLALVLAAARPLGLFGLTALGAASYLMAAWASGAIGPAELELFRLGRRQPTAPAVATVPPVSP
ncbi:flippase [Candidatus Parcubacteria bacterium]|nr:flippase [Candidatus Parcubacteria bacterium]